MIRDFQSKPLLLYCMPRSRSTAILQSCKKNIKLFEPFNPLILFGVDYSNVEDINIRNKMYLEAHKKYRNLSSWYESGVPEHKWDKLFLSLSGADTVSKIISNSLYQWMKARLWFRDVEKTQSHNIIVIWRKISDVIISNILADNFGYFKNIEVSPFMFTVQEESIYAYRQQVEYFLQFMPKQAYMVSFEDLPAEYFNKNLVTISDQKSSNKLRYIKNLDFVLEQIDCIEKTYKPLVEESLDRLTKL